MFHSTRKQDKNKNIAKFLDPKRDTHGRMKALRNVLDIEADHNLSSFFTEYYGAIYYLFYEEFTNLELSAKSKGSRIKDELEELLLLLEKIFIYLPDKIYARWQFNSIGLILRKLLHHGNVLSLREQGLRLFMLWLHIMQEKIDEFNLALYASVIPGFPSPIEKIDIPANQQRSLEYAISCVNGQVTSNVQAASQNYFQTAYDNEEEWCIHEGCSALCPPQQGDKIPSAEELTKKFLVRVLHFMTRRILELHWSDKQMRGTGFYHVFNHFKRFYLPIVFPLWDPKDYLYQQCDMISVPINSCEHQQAGTIAHASAVLLFCQCAVFGWLVKFAVVRIRRTHAEVQSSSLDYESSTMLLNEPSASESMNSAEVPPTTEHSPPLSKDYEMLCDAANIVRSALYSTQENVTVVHEIFRQGFLMPLTCIDIMNHILQVYREWLFKLKDRPLFMLEAKKDRDTLLALVREAAACDSPMLRTPSYKEAVTSSENFFFTNLPVENVRAGFQSNLRLFIAISAQIFFVKTSPDLLPKHVDICRKVMKVYRNVVLEMRLDECTWHQLLTVLLKIANYILTSRPPIPRTSTLGGQLAGYLLQTLFVTWVRGSMQVHIKTELWDELLNIGVTFNCWEELVKEWAGTMGTLTRVMARTVYGIDIQDPPLEKLTVRGQVKRFKRKVTTEQFDNERPSKNNRPLSDQVQKQMLNPNSNTIPRSASEPGIGYGKGSMKKSSHVSEGSMQIHNEKVTEEDDTTNIFNTQMHLKKTLAEIAHTKTESIDSDTNSVFTHSINSGGNFHNELQQQRQLQRIIPQLTIESIDSDENEEANTEATLNALIMYEPLNDISETSSANIPYSASLHSINSESSQNLLQDFHGSKEFVDPNDFAVNFHTDTEPPSTDHSNRTSGVSEVLSDQILSTHDSLTSDQDLIRFDADMAMHAMKQMPSALDAQSIDSHRFAMIENEMKHCSHDNIEETAEDDDSSDNDHDETTVTHVRFEQQEEDEDVKEDCTLSVIEGGKLEGWIPLSSVVLWQRFIGMLGNVNEIADSEVHASVFNHLIEIWQMLEVIKKNQGISIDNKSTPTPPQLTPPLYFCAPWCVQAMSQVYEVSHKHGRVLAYKLLCMSVMSNHGLKPPQNLMIHFYRLIHIGLTATDQEVINAIIGECSLLFSSELPGISCLILDFIQAATTVISTQYLMYPRKEAVSLLGSMICLPGAYPDLKIYQTSLRGNETHIAMKGRELREKVLLPLFKAVKNDPSCRARCVALDSLGLFVVESLVKVGGHQRIYECLSLLLSSLEFHSQVVSSVALDVLWSLTFYYKEFALFDAHLPLKLIEAMSHIALHLHSSLPQGSNSDLPIEDTPEYISKLLLCLLDWVMVVPKDLLLKNCSERESDTTYLGLVIKVLNECHKERPTHPPFERRISLNVNQIFLGDSRPVRLARVHNDLKKDHSTGGAGGGGGITEDDEDDTDFLPPDSNNKDSLLLKLTAHYAISQILNYYEHFPFNTGSVQPGSTVVENEDQSCDDVDDAALLDNDHMQFLLVNGTTLLTVKEIKQEETFESATSFNGLKTVSRFILRDAVGKYSWDISDLFTINHQQKTDEGKDLSVKKRSSLERKHSRNLSITMSRLTSTCPSDILPTWQSIDKNTDRTDQLLRYIGYSSPECLLYSDQLLNVPSPVPSSIDVSIQSSIVTCVLKQHNEEENYVHEIGQAPSIMATEILSPEYNDPRSPFHVSKLLLHQLGYFSAHNRENIELLERNGRLLREIKNLDNRPCRETQKIAVFYVGPGQEDKHSILSNTEGSVMFEKFLAGMSWEVDLEVHTGFMGGLERNLSTGASACYYSSHSLEIMFHVSTRMPGQGEEQLKTKFRHLGNDEIHVIWSEHNRDFRRGIINTEFADVLIIIYPLKHNLFRIQIDKNSKIPPFGPLFDGAIIDGDLLPSLVRSTAVNAGRAKRSTLPLFRRHFEERFRCINEISQNRVHKSSFEDFCSRLFAPTFATDATNLQDSTDGVYRTTSLPSRTNTLTDPSTVLKMLDITEHQTFRSRASSALPPRKPSSNKKEIYRTSSNTSLNNITEDGTTSGGGLFSDGDITKDFINRRKSLTKKLKKKASSMDVGFLSNEKLAEKPAEKPDE